VKGGQIDANRLLDASPWYAFRAKAGKESPRGPPAGHFWAVGGASGGKVFICEHAFFRVRKRRDPGRAEVRLLRCQVFEIFPRALSG
jgi:hypothetical protein